MKKILFIYFLLLQNEVLFSQTYWTEDFGAGCNTGQLATNYSGINGNWNLTLTDTNGTVANEWYISASSSNNGAGSCSSSCDFGGPNNQTLHIGNVAGSPGAALFCPNGDCGESYDATGCSGSDCVFTSKRIESPIIDLTGKSGLQMSFIYMHGGVPGTDFGRIWFFDGTNWNADTIPPSTDGMPCSQFGIWTYLMLDLPAYADNNPNFRIGFEWKNNNDGNGNDPAFSVDDIKIGNGFNAQAEFSTNEFSYIVNENEIQLFYPFPINTEVYDLSGKLVASYTNQNSIPIIKSGLFLIRVISGDFHTAFKVST